MANLTPHFTEAELGALGAPPQYRANLQRTAELGEAMRAAAGVRFVKVSGYRSPEKNAATPNASKTSQHLTGEAMDFTPEGISLYQFVQRIQDAAKNGNLPTWGQLIVYPFTTGHVHLSLPTATHRNEIRVAVAEGGDQKYPFLTDGLLATFPGAAPAVSGLLVLLIVAAVVFFSSRG